MDRWLSVTSSARTEGRAPWRVERRAAKGGQRMRYEVVFDCRDRSIGERLRGQLEDAIVEGADDHGYEELARSEEGPSTWGVTVTFVDHRAADRFFRGEAYRQFCVEVRRMCQAPVYVVPLG